MTSFISVLTKIAFYPVISEHFLLTSGFVAFFWQAYNLSLHYLNFYYWDIAHSVCMKN